LPAPKEKNCSNRKGGGEKRGVTDGPAPYSSRGRGPGRKGKGFFSKRANFYHTGGKGGEKQVDLAPLHLASDVGGRDELLAIMKGKRKGRRRSGRRAPLSPVFACPGLRGGRGKRGRIRTGSFSFLSAFTGGGREEMR